ncbi:hypothetical protein [Flavobacterium sp. ABG]|uniref:hypothetical protein n=1 Tax=Flavobacterium sp. ABG TaxID=1423322 RepID=UPI00064AB845|nr:hypothetical protein [Flavobacterium sp. ABG]KLT68572.1 hypothetical protein AB674_17235 [Flavobacterium sp. ABG]
MDNQDKLFEKIKQASHNAESKDFPAMEKVWSRVEEKLDKKEAKKTIALWKKIAIAASLLLVISLGSQFIKTDNSQTIQNTNKVVTTETKTEPIQKPILEESKVAVSENSKIVPQKEAEKIIDNQIKHQKEVVQNDIQSPNAAAVIAHETVKAEASAKAYIPAPVMAPAYATEERSYLKDKAFATEELSKSAKSESYRIADAEASPQMAKKSAPLVIMNGKALSHNDDIKRDKMMQAELSNLSPENVESLVVLAEPLYIIDGNYYSENDLFGKNPTSPYAPLNKQEIKTITILQDLEATSKYGEKGKKGVIIITTKTGKPASQH